jgi:hypothetical protein
MSRYKKAVLLMLILMCSCLTTAPIQAKKTVLNVPEDYSTIEEAVFAANPGDTIKVGPGEYAGCYLDKQVTIIGSGETIINDGPVHGSGLIQGFRLMAGSDGSILRNLIFTVDLVIMNGAAVDNVEVTHNTFLNVIQAVSNWCGSGWSITHNEIIDLRTRNGGGIGIMVADFSGGTVSNNLIAYNKITGTLHVDSDDGGGYSGSGIVLYADFRWGGAGAVAITGNVVKHNKVSLVSDTPGVVDVVAFELSDTRDDPELEPVVYDNYICFNDFRGTEIHIALTPVELADCNTISRNLGDNRGHGLHPKGY